VKEDDYIPEASGPLGERPLENAEMMASHLIMNKK
jgi:hypothetical protein